MKQQKEKRTEKEEKKKLNRKYTCACSQQYIQHHLNQYIEPKSENARNKRTVPKEPIRPIGGKLIEKRKELLALDFKTSWDQASMIDSMSYQRR